jgi:hypothetical protein
MGKIFLLAFSTPKAPEKKGTQFENRSSINFKTNIGLLRGNIRLLNFYVRLLRKDVRLL